ncbi:unnamed protein product [Paramecium sonneborni]|uniref:Uncharacterized protein n=1 Tax=Paramecium sonneborni TaxID=65129 RepID=A0A8S1N3S9_9CILI|nr:unnamed protein product [Paramecium sonneborni]
MICCHEHTKLLKEDVYMKMKKVVNELPYLYSVSLSNVLLLLHNQQTKQKIHDFQYEVLHN